MKNKKAWKLILKIFLWAVGILAVLAVTAFLLMKFVFIPKLAENMRNKGMEEIAVFVENNADVGTMVQVTGVLTDGGMIEFIKNLDGSGISSAIDVLDDISKDEGIETAFEEPSAPLENPKETNEEKPADNEQKAETAYDRISKAASKQEMEDGLRIISKLDMGYIASLLSGGLTAQEKSELKSYVYETLPQSDIQIALKLYNKYKKYL